MIEALASGRPVVTTPAALHGLPEHVRLQFAVGATSQDFAAAALEILGADERAIDPSERAALVDEFFGSRQLRPLIDAVDRLSAAGLGVDARTDLLLGRPKA
jgi:hypothetical protein